MPPRLNLTGRTFGQLTAITISHQDRWGAWHWNCVCSCGAHVTAKASGLNTGAAYACSLCTATDSQQRGGLSLGQLAALRLVANGLTAREAAKELGTTERAVYVRVSLAAAALGAHSRTHAVALAMARGLIRVDEIRPGKGPQKPQGAA